MNIHLLLKIISKYVYHNYTFFSQFIVNNHFDFTRHQQCVDEHAIPFQFFFFLRHNNASSGHCRRTIWCN